LSTCDTVSRKEGIKILALFFIVGAYLLGSIPFALVVGKGIYNTDVRDLGSGNIGTTNVFRVLGKTAGTFVFIGDAAKGFLPVFLATQLVEPESVALISVLTAGAAIAGHTWSIFLKGKGGKGVATGGGAVIALMPLLFLLAFAVFWIVLLAGRIVSVASLSAATALCITVVATGQPLPYVVFTLLGTAVIFYSHRSNIKRLVNKEENQVTFPWNKSSRRNTRHNKYRHGQDCDESALNVVPGSSKKGKAISGKTKPREPAR
jgi:glycerol-3-phosphate acyltransferase PlsY